MEFGPVERTQARAAFAEIGAQAAQTNRTRHAQLEAIITSAKNGRLQPAERVRAQEIAHQLAGSAGTFGYHQASELARGLEEFLGAHQCDNPAQLNEAHQLLMALARELARAPEPMED